MKLGIVAIGPAWYCYWILRPNTLRLLSIVNLYFIFIRIAIVPEAYPPIPLVTSHSRISALPISPQISRPNRMPMGYISCFVTMMAIVKSVCKLAPYYVCLGSIEKDIFKTPFSTIESRESYGVPIGAYPKVALAIRHQITTDL